MEGDKSSTSWENFVVGSTGRTKGLWRGRTGKGKGVGSVSGSSHYQKEKKEGNGKSLGVECCAIEVGDRTGVHP